MELDPNDYDVVKLLAKLKNTNITIAYPPELLTPRRETYLHRVTEIGFGLAAGIKTGIKTSNKTRSFSSTGSTLIEAALVAAIIAEAGVATYLYREQISALIKSLFLVA